VPFCLLRIVKGIGIVEEIESCAVFQLGGETETFHFLVVVRYLSHFLFEFIEGGLFVAHF
jgi:hypothetical protein